MGKFKFWNEHNKVWVVITLVSSAFAVGAYVWDFIKPPIKIVVDWGGRLATVEQKIEDGAQDRQDIKGVIGNFNIQNDADHKEIKQMLSDQNKELSQVGKDTAEVKGELKVLTKYLTERVTLVDPDSPERIR